MTKISSFSELRLRYYKETGKSWIDNNSNIQDEYVTWLETLIVDTGCSTEKKDKYNFVDGGYAGENNIIQSAIQQLKDNKYDPKAIWISFDGKIFYVVTDKIDRSKFLKLFKKLE